ncbi:histone deacetylase 6 isoform X1 [Diabrotica undecimpunctata]|uniref:histone deacetylase 6 isoform X1 n=1 Tax=Diabrotica undecimpunctata TaxID=50387 RepID=UPI003B63AA96
MGDKGKSDNDPGASMISKSPGGIQKLSQFLAEKRKRKVKLEQPVSTLKDPFELVNNCITIAPSKTGYIQEESLSHYCIWDSLYPENVERVACAERRINALELKHRCVLVPRLHFSTEVFLKKHTPELLEKLKLTKELSGEDLRTFSSKYDAVYFTQQTYDSAMAAAESVLSLTQEVMTGNLRNGLALVRPPGHHAMSNEFCGYCFINNVAIAAEMALSSGHAKRVLIVDYDVHHGQATQQMFYDRKDVLYFSIHRYEQGTFWPNLRESDFDFIGEGVGTGHNINIPLNATGLNDSDYLAIILNVLLPVAYQYNPDLVLVSAGYDASIGCPEGEMLVTPAFYGHLITLLSGLANGRLVVCLEGGYFPESLAEGVVCSLKALLGDPCYPLNITEVHPEVIKVINSAIYYLRSTWDCLNLMDCFSYPKDDVPLKECLSINSENEHLSKIIYRFTPQPTTVYETTGFYPVRSEKEVFKFTKMIEDLRTAYASIYNFSHEVGYVYDELLLKHKCKITTGKEVPERPERITEIIKTFDKFGLMERLKHIQDDQLVDCEAWVQKVHHLQYVDRILRLQDLPSQPDWYRNEFTADCILKCVSCILTLINSIQSNIVRSGVAVVRPPGHHACHEIGSGFCFVNNAVIAANYLIDVHKYSRILIVDFDIHHGNGTQDLTFERNDIMYISIHRFDSAKFFPFCKKGDVDNIGTGLGEGYNVNIPFNSGNKTDVDYWAVWHKLVLPLAYSYDPQFVIVSAGFDAAYFDPLGNGYKVSPEMYGQFIQTLKPLACGKQLILLEGGYHLESTALSMTMCVKALLGDPLPVPRFDEKIGAETRATIKEVLNTHKSNWKFLQVNKNIANFACTDDQYHLLETALEEEINGRGSVENFRKKITAIIKN